MEKNFSGLPSWAKGTIAVIATVGLVVGVFYSVRGVKKLIALRDEQNSKDEVNASEDELTKLNKSSATKQKITTAQAEGYANSLDAMMDGYGTNEQGIKDMFYKVSNDADVLAIVKAYGVRTLSSGNYNPEPNFKGALAGAINNELDSFWIGKINEIFKKKKIKYRF
jgi:hypothetical protein